MGGGREAHPHTSLCHPSARLFLGDKVRPAVSRLFCRKDLRGACGTAAWERSTRHRFDGVPVMARTKYIPKVSTTTTTTVRTSPILDRKLQRQICLRTNLFPK